MQRSADFSHAADLLVTLDCVDAENIGVLGICGGYATNATMLERRIKALVAVVPVNYGRLMQEGFSQFDPVAMLEQVAQQRTQEARRGDAQVNELLPASPEAAKEAGQIDRDVIGDRGPARSAPTATAWNSMATSRAAPTASCSCSA